MRYLLVLVSAALLFSALGCGGGGKPPEGYSISDGWVTTPSGLRYRDVQVVAEGLRIDDNSSVSAYYKGWLDDGTVFDQKTPDDGDPLTFQMGQMIEGWNKGLIGLRAGAVTELIIPPALAYGDQPPEGSIIPPNATLHFLVEIVSVH
jgi:FKBP-type peptidyl-prolyl cis-trans isomerase